MLTVEDKNFIANAIGEVSMDVSDLAAMTAAEFRRIEQKMDDRFDGVNRRLDDLATNRVRNDIYEGLEKRVNKLEKTVYAKI